MKRIIFFIAMAFTLCATNKAEAHDFWAVNADGDTIWYNLVEGTTNVVVTYKGNSINEDRNRYSETINIPAQVMYNGVNYIVSHIGKSAFENCRGLTSIIIPNTVRTINKRAFNNCYYLTSVTIGESVETIGDSAFYMCSDLTMINIPNSVKTIGVHAFYYCSDLTSINVPNSVTEINRGAFSMCFKLDSITLSDSLTVIADDIFSGCRRLASVNIPSSVATIGSYAFSMCDSLTSITIPNSVFTIGESAFGGCSKLDSVIIPNSVTIINNGVFQYCRSLTYISIPNSVTSIEDGAFSGCSGLISINIPNSVNVIGNWAFSGCSSLSSISIPNSVTSIKSSAFQDCNNLNSIVLPNLIDTIDVSVFQNCTSLSSISIPNSVKIIKSAAFSGSGLNSVHIPNSVSCIENAAFIFCRNITSITIPNSVIEIGMRAFYYCDRLDSVICMANIPPTLGDECFASTPNDKVLKVLCSSELAYQSLWGTYFSNILTQPNEIFLATTICQTENYTENGFALINVQESGVHTLNLQTLNGCDSIVTLNLTVNPVYATPLTATICQGEDYIENGFSLYNVQESGVHTLNLQSINGCDSIVTLNLTVNPVYSTSLTDEVCFGSDYIANGFNIINAQQSGVHTLNLQTVNGCDSIVSLNLTVNPVYSTPLTATICQGTDYTNYGFALYNVQESGVHTLNLHALNGCDSIVVLTLTVNPIFEITLMDEICFGEDYTENGFNLTNVQESGVNTLELQTINGCDSIVVLNLIVNPVYYTPISAAICRGEDYIENGFALYNVQQSRVHTLELQSVKGCDSIVTLNLTINPTYQTIFNAVVCQGTDYTLNGFNIVDAQENGVHTLNLESVNGCDSTIILNLAVNPVYSTALSATICQGESYTENGFTLINVQESGVHTLNLQTENGCDSIVTLTLTVNPIFSTQLTAAICRGESYTENGFNILNAQQSGEYTLYLQTINGCDSIVVLNLIVNPNYENTINAIVCQGSDYTANGFNLTNVQESGVHTQNLQTINGCDSIITLNLTVNPTLAMELFATICHGADYMENGFSLTDVQEGGEFTQTLVAVNGCDSIVTLTLTVLPTAETIIEVNVCQGSDYTENGFNIPNVQESCTHTRLWQTYRGCDSIVVLNLTVLPTFETTLETTINAGADYTENGFNLTNVQESGIFTQTLTAENGCDSVIVLNLTVNSGLSEVENALSVQLFPNPAEDFATLKLENLNSKAELVVFDVQGKTIIRKEVAEGEGEVRLELSNLAAGTYTVSITSSEGTTTRKLIKK